MMEGEVQRLEDFIGRNRRDVEGLLVDKRVVMVRAKQLVRLQFPVQAFFRKGA